MRTKTKPNKICFKVLQQQEPEQDFEKLWDVLLISDENAAY